MEGKIAFIDTIPADARGLTSINLGYELVAIKSKADCYFWRDIVDKEYDVYMFNIFYPLHIFNMNAFLRKNKIPILKQERKGYPKVIVGGQGVSNLNGCLDEIVDEIYKGEYDSDTEINGWNRAEKLSSPPISKYGTSMIELTRGCKYRCAFCEYGWVQGGKFREKPFEQVKKDIALVKETTSSKRINFLSANIGSYSKLEELTDYANSLGIRISNGDVCLNDIKYAKKHFEKLKSVSVGIESFSEGTRKAIHKNFDDEKLEDFVNWATNHMSNIHFYLIYGLPNDDYNAWHEWLKKLGTFRKNITDRPLRMEFNITNFEPCKGTPLENAPWVDFTEKDYFLKHWTKGLKDNGFRMGNTEITYANGRGRLGRKEPSYKTLMYLKTRDSSITNAIINSFKNGVTRSLDEDKANEFIRLCEETKNNE